MQEIKQHLLEAKNIVITTHKSPDGDAIGSTLAWFHFLKKLKKNVHVIVPDSFPDFLNWMDGSAEIIYYDKQTAFATELIENSDFICSLDYSSLNRIDEMGNIISKTNAFKMVIDHHQNPQPFANYYFVDTNCCSTSQLVYEFIDKLNELDVLDQSIAECLYCGIMTDTGSFRYPSTTARTHQIIAECLKLKADGAKIHQQVYDTYSEKRLRLLGYALTNKMKVFYDLSAAYIYLSQEELQHYDFKKGDTEGLVNYPLSILGIKVSVLITEKENNEISMSFRSKENYFVNEFAHKYFNGGGHVYAAGGRLVNTSLEQTIRMLEQLLRSEKLYK